MNTKELILKTARDMIQRMGYNGFSYADIAKEVGIRKASIHHHFATKALLGCEVASDYRLDFMKALSSIDRLNFNNVKKLQAYMNLFQQTLEQDHKVCLGAMMATDQEALPEAVLQQVNLFFKENDIWLTELIKKGIIDGEFSNTNSPQMVAQSILSSLEGGMVLGRAMNDYSRIETISKWILSNLKI